MFLLEVSYYKFYEKYVYISRNCQHGSKVIVSLILNNKIEDITTNYLGNRIIGVYHHFQQFFNFIMTTRLKLTGEI